LTTIFIAIVEDEQNREGKIVGGSTVVLGQVPSRVSLRSLLNFHFCGGTILSNRWILTSAQCTAGRASDGINVVVGSITLSAGSGEVTHRSFNITRHPSFDPVTQTNE
jgi:secreted trypsin-like serine protease